VKVVIITQDDPFYLPDALQKLMARAEGKHEIVGVVLLSASPFGKKESFAKKALKTYQIFGLVFFIRYAVQFLYAKIFRRNGVAKVFESRGIPMIHLEGSINRPESLAKIAEYKPDLLLSIAGNEIFKQPLLDLAPKGCLNLHTALLPEYRGLMPTFWVLKNRETHTGVSVFLVDEGIDSGPLVSQVKVEIGNSTQQQLIKQTKDIGMTCIVEAMDEMEKDTPHLMESNAENASYFGFPTREDVRAFKAAARNFSRGAGCVF